MRHECRDADAGLAERDGRRFNRGNVGLEAQFGADDLHGLEPTSEQQRPGALGVGRAQPVASARARKQPLYITQCTADTRPEDLIVTPVLAESGRIAYHASPLVSAMLTGGVCVLD